jgi:hypothetical protein
MTSDQFSRALDVLIEHKLKKRLERLCAELGQQCDLRVSGSADGRSMPVRQLHIGTTGAAASAEARVMLRPSAKERSIRVAYKVVVHGMASESNFSGFMSDGRVELSDGSASVRIDSIVLNYGDWSFPAPFDFEARGPIDSA